MGRFAPSLRSLNIKNRAHENSHFGYYLLAKIYELLFILAEDKQKENSYIEKAKNYILTLYSSNISIEKLADFGNLDRRYLCRIFKNKTGFTLQQYLLNTRLEKAYSLVVSTDLSIYHIVLSVGYRDLYNFSRIFKKKYLKSPLAVRKT